MSQVNLSAHAIANLNHFLDFCGFCRVIVQVKHALGSSKNQTDGIVTRQLSVLFETKKNYNAFNNNERNKLKRNHFDSYISGSVYLSTRRMTPIDS